MTRVSGTVCVLENMAVGSRPQPQTAPESGAWAVLLSRGLCRCYLLRWYLARDDNNSAPFRTA